MIPERDQLTVGVHAALEEVEAGRAIEIVPHVVFAGPQQLHRGADDFGDPGCLDHVVVAQPPAEATAGADHVDLDRGSRNAQRGRDQCRARGGILGRRPDLDLAVLDMRRAVLRLQIDV